MKQQTALAFLIEERCRELGLSQLDLGHRLGCPNPAKAVGRVQALCSQPPFSTKSIAAYIRLPEILDLTPDVVEQAVVITVRLFEAELALERERLSQERDRAEQAWRASFVPHAVLVAEHDVPTQITMCVLTGGARRWLHIPLDTTQSPISFVGQATTALPTHAQTAGDGRAFVAFFGEVTGFVVNFAPDAALHCDLAGHPMQVLVKAYRPGVFGLPANRPPSLTARDEG